MCMQQRRVDKEKERDMQQRRIAKQERDMQWRRVAKEKERESAIQKDS